MQRTIPRRWRSLGMVIFCITNASLLFELAMIPLVESFVTNPHMALVYGNSKDGTLPRWAASLSAEDKNDYSVAIGQDAMITTETLKFPHSLLVEGSLYANLLVCSDGGSERESQVTRVRITPGATLSANIQDVEIVEVFGKVIGDIQCTRLIVGQGGEIMGDVNVVDITMAGGTIEGTVRCGLQTQPIQMNGMPPPTTPKLSDKPDIEFWKGMSMGGGVLENNRNNNNCYNGAGIKHYAANGENKDQQQPYSKEENEDAIPDHHHSIHLLNPGTMLDDFGNNLFLGPSDAQVRSLNKNRDQIHETRRLLDQGRSDKHKILPIANGRSSKSNGRAATAVANHGQGHTEGKGKTERNFKRHDGQIFY